MDPGFIRILIWLAAVIITWTSARALVAVLNSSATDNAKAGWIALIVCTPIIGPIAYWLLSGGGEFTKGTPEEREAALKARMNKNQNGA